MHDRFHSSRVPRVSIAILALVVAVHAQALGASPNVVLILCDNLGYGDVGCYGSKLHHTPHIDGLAAEGMRFTDCYAASGVCTPSRAALMTGCYPRRLNLHVSDTGASVLQPVSSKGLHPNEMTIAEILKSRGYATACLGKWHLGDQPKFLPTRQGFDSYLGIPYSDDMTPRPGKPWPPLPMIKGERVIDAPVDLRTVTERYTEAAVEFLRNHRDRRFFLYLAHATPGSTKSPSVGESFRGRSANGPWGDAVEEIDWSTGEILSALESLGLSENTLVVWTNDNGAPRRQPPQGSNAPLRGWGYGTSEGGMRVPLIVRWTGHVPAGVTCSEVVSLLDLLPTIARLAGTELPANRLIDGKDIGPLLRGEPGARSPHEAIYFYHMDQLQAVRAGRWKLYVTADKRDGRESVRTPRLFDLEADESEDTDQATVRPDVIRRLQTYVAKARADLGDGNVPGLGQRPAGHVDQPTARVAIP